MKSFQQILADRGLDDHGKVQRYIDSEVIRLMSPYTPKDSGAGIDSATRLTDIGSGKVMQGGGKCSIYEEMVLYPSKLYRCSNERNILV